MGQARQGAADDGTADAEDFAQRLFAQLGAGRQALFEDGVEDVGVDDLVLGAAAALAIARLLLELLQLVGHRYRTLLIRPSAWSESIRGTAK
ncbi:hypothetical protein D3C81_1822810 [compost metagenome]